MHEHEHVRNERDIVITCNFEPRARFLPVFYLKFSLTDMYDRVPTNDIAIESINWPLTPKSHILISPLVFTRMLDGFTSEKQAKASIRQDCTHYFTLLYGVGKNFSF